VALFSYLRFSLLSSADLAEFEQDMHSMLALAEKQPGFQWAEMGASMTDEHVYVVVSEWDDVEHARAWEHVEEHTGVMEKWEAQYREAFIHRRFVPWLRPAPA
jgi:heme-degrading monooxygenase HmoA